MTLKRCPKCGNEKPLDAFARNHKLSDGRQTYCRECKKAFYQADAPRLLARMHERYERKKEELKAYGRAHYHRNAPTIALKQSVRSLAIRQIVFGHYGTACACCGENDLRLLTIDHVAGVTKAERKQQGWGGGGLYRWLIRNSFPVGFQSLCYNCNLGRAKNGGICPHKDPPMV